MSIKNYDTGKPQGANSNWYVTGNDNKSNWNCKLNIECDMSKYQLYFNNYKLVLKLD